MRKLAAPFILLAVLAVGGCASLFGPETQTPRARLLIAEYALEAVANELVAAAGEGRISGARAETAALLLATSYEALRQARVAVATGERPDAALLALEIALAAAADYVRGLRTPPSPSAPRSPPARNG